MDLIMMNLQQLKYSFSFVLLYYKDYENTIKCVESIYKLESNEYDISIVIVDNCSNDGSIDKLKEIYDKRIYYIKNEENVGFAKGNNIGINFSRESLKSDFIIVLNTDTIIEQLNFCKIVIDVYNKEKFDVMGPAVKGYYSGKDQSPIYVTYEQSTIKKIIKDLFSWIAWKTNIIKYINKYKKKINNDSIFNIKKIDRHKCVCSGCCLIFSPHFFKRWKGFYPNTFLYREESILFYIVNKLGGKTLFSEEIMIRHKGGESTANALGKDERKRNLKIYSYRLQSLKEEYKLKRMNKEELNNQI